MAMVYFTRMYEDIGVHTPLWQNARELIDNASKDIVNDLVKVVKDVHSNVELFADPLISKVFHNLIDNAVKHGKTVSTMHFFMEERGEARFIVCQGDGRNR